MKTLIHAAIRCSLTFLVTASLFSVQPAQAYTVMREQVGSNVVATGSGAFGGDIAGMLFNGGGLKQRPQLACSRQSEDSVDIDVQKRSLISQDISGTWTFIPTACTGTCPGQTTITVPGGGWYSQGFSTVNEADYKRTITIPNLGQAQVTRIRLGAVNYESTLYLCPGTGCSNFTQVDTTKTTSWTPAVFDGRELIPSPSSNRLYGDCRR